MAGNDFGWALQQMRAGKAVASPSHPCWGRGGPPFALAYAEVKAVGFAAIMIVPLVELERLEAEDLGEDFDDAMPVQDRVTQLDSLPAGLALATDWMPAADYVAQYVAQEMRRRAERNAAIAKAAA